MKKTLVLVGLTLGIVLGLFGSYLGSTVKESMKEEKLDERNYDFTVYEDEDGTIKVQGEYIPDEKRSTKKVADKIKKDFENTVTYWETVSTEW